MQIKTRQKQRQRLSQGQGRRTERTIMAVDGNCDAYKYQQRKSRKDCQSSEEVGEL